MKKLTPEYTRQHIKTQEEESHKEKNAPYFRFYESWITLLGAWEAHLYGILVNRSQRLSFTYISGSSLLKTLGVSQATLTRLLSSLEKKGAIYRYVLTEPGGGKKRMIIPFQMAHEYWSKYLKNSANDQKYSDFKLFMTQKRDPKSLIINPTPECSPVSIRDCSPVSIRDCSSVSNREHKDKKIKKEKNILLHTSSLPESAMESSEEEEFLQFDRGLRERGFSVEQIEIGKRFFLAFYGEVKSKSSPMGYLVNSIRKGIAADRLQQTPRNDEILRAKGDSTERDNRARAKKSAESLRGVPGVRIQETCIHFSWPGGSVVLGWGEENFEQKLCACVHKMETLSRSSGEASRVGESQASGEQVLRFAAKTEKDSPNGSPNGPRNPSEGVRSSQNACRVSYAYAEELEPYAAFKSVWASSPPKA